MRVVKSLEELGVFAKEFLAAHLKGTVVGLSGDLGAGKTTFVRECVGRLSTAPTRVMSPTYVLHQTYPTARPVHHYDLYRLENVAEAALLEIQYFTAVEEARRKDGFVFVEWPEKCSDLKILTLDIHLKFEIRGEERVIYAL